MINVVVTSMGSNTAIGVVKALRYNKNISINIIGTDTFPKHLSAGSSLVDFFYQVPLANDDNYEAQLLNIIKTHEVDCVIPIHDYEVKKIADIAAIFPAATFWAVNNSSTIALCNNKKEVNNLLSAHQIDVPEMYGSIQEILYPAIYKPLDGVSSKGIKMIYSAADAQLFNLDKGFLQKMVKGIEYTVDCYSSYKDDYFNCCVRERIETKEGMSTKGKTVKYALLENICAKIHQLLHYKGASNIQFIVENGVPYFIEINPRFSGAGVLSYYSNFNSPLFTVLESVQSPLFNDIKKIPIKQGVFMTRYWSENFYEE
jgi:carbamoyl-phosphate synthase large subunit